MAHPDFKGSFCSDPSITTAAKKLVENPSNSAGLIIAIVEMTRAVAETIKDRIEKEHPTH